ncbi:GNAT family N-acetyltransferase [Streptomyces tsukubensis]|uniref:GNAT family N-acetyltransferase n=1 Tax=Streptomyces tsukubensis TaxID=83656 RepID=UPI0036829A43
MTPPPGTVTVTRLDGPATARAEAAFRTVYTEVFAEPPYRETDDDVAHAFRRFAAQTRRAGFRGALARDGAGDPVGIAYGHPLPPETPWWGNLLEPVDAELRREDGRRTFGLMELAVRSAWRRRGIARRLHDAVLAGVDCERVLLNVHSGNTAATAAYRSWGYGRVGAADPGEGADLHDLMLLPLR